MNPSSSPGFPGLPQPAARSQPPPRGFRRMATELLGHPSQWVKLDARPDWPNLLCHQLAHVLGISPRAVERWINGQNEAPQAVLDRMAEMLTIARRSRADAAADRALQARERASG